ncbi:MAG: glycosyltransferase family 2 protein [bacterium]
MIIQNPRRDSKKSLKRIPKNMHLESNQGKNPNNSNQPMLSVVVPVYNEEVNVVPLHREIITALGKTGRTFEIIFVNDGSKDHTFPVLQKLSPITIINLQRNFGQSAALDAGLKISRGKYVITIDGDGQNDPGDIPRMIRCLEKNNLDVLCGWRKYRKDNFSKIFISQGASKLRKMLFRDKIHDSGCTLKIFRHHCLASLDLYGEMHRFIPALMQIKGFKIGEVVVNHRPRRGGKTKYGLSRIIWGFIDMISIWFWKNYADRPLRLFGGLGLLFLFIGFILGLWAIYQKIFQGIDLSDTILTLLAVFISLVGLQLFVTGIIADAIAKNYYTASKDKPYLIREIIKK